MLFPIIKVKNNSCDHEHIIGTNSHDCLYVKDNAIRYLNLQCCCGTEMRGIDDFADVLVRELGKYADDIDYEFSPTNLRTVKEAINKIKERWDEPEYSFSAPEIEEDEESSSGHPEIEFVDFDELLELMTGHLNEAMQNKIDCYRALRKHWDEEFEKVQKETGIRGDTAGTLA